MVKSLYSGVSGLKTHQSKMDVIGNNIANVNTTGFKTGVVTFKDVYYQNKINPSSGTATLGGVNPAQVGYGVRLNSTVANMTQSGFNYTDSKWDMALDGEGFFQVMDGSGNIFYTRAGAFKVDAEGYLVNASGFHVLGVTGDSEGVEPSSEVIRIIIPDTDAHASSATKKVNGVNVTLSVSAPSDHTDMSVTFTPAEYPYATYANGILNIFFNQDEQYASEDAFEQAIQKALDAGGITLPDDVSLQFEFESIPDNPEAVIAANGVVGLPFKTDNDSCMFHDTYTEIDATGSTKTKHAYMGFATTKVMGSKVSVKINYDNAATEIGADYTPGDSTWTITVNDNVDAQKINEAIKKKTSADITLPELTCTNFVLPSDAAKKTKVLENWENGGAIKTDGTDHGSGGFDVAATVAGEYANNYKVTFAYVAGYGKTSAVWNENELTITVSNDTTVADINEKIKTAASGDEKKILKMANISGLLNNKIEASQTADGKYNVIITDPSGAQKVIMGATDAKGTGGTSTTFLRPDGTTGTVDDFTEEANPAPTNWNPQMREAFFGGHPSINPMEGDDSFFTGVAKSLSTFALEDGRLGGPQPLDSCEVTIQTDGTIIGRHPVHGYITLGRIDIALFENPNGLSQVGGTNFAETVASGPAKVSIAGGDEGAGNVLSNTLEMSNVDLSQEFTDMITTQRGFQANSRVITVSDTMLEELLSLKR